MRKWFWSILVAIAGFFVGIWWMRERDATTPTLRTQPPPTPPKPSQPDASKQPSTAPATEQDDLTVINGVGPAFERALNAAGVYTFEQLAAVDIDALASQLDARGLTAERIRREEWLEQAKTILEERQ